jgi:phospholipid-binding lipoprotein MlaA
MVPLLGPYTLRDLAGRAGDTFLTPLSYLDPTWAALGAGTLDLVNRTSFRIGDYEALKASAVDHYLAIRNAYVQYRLIQINE